MVNKTSAYHRNKRNLPVGYKPCPHCKGTGQVLCNGREVHQEKSRLWAEQMHGKMVTILFLKSLKHIGEGPPYETVDEWVRIPGLAIKRKAPGGWWGVRVYISRDIAPHWGGWPRHGYENDLEEIGRHKYYFIDKGADYTGEEVQLMDLQDITPELKPVLTLTDGK